MSASLDGVEAILFDLGGTCLELDHPRIAEAAAARGHVPGPDWVARAEKAARRRLAAIVAGGEGESTNETHWQSQLYAMLREAGCADQDCPAIHDELRAFHRRHHLWNRVMPGIPETLRALGGRGYRLAALSNSDGRAEALLARLGLAQEFEFVIDSHDVGLEKPDPRIFHLACERLALPPHRCAYVGDVVPIDVDGARAAGLAPVLFDPYGAYSEAGDVGAPRIAEPAQLLGLFPDRRHELGRRAAGGRR